MFKIVSSFTKSLTEWVNTSWPKIVTNENILENKESDYLKAKRKYPYVQSYLMRIKKETILQKFQFNEKKILEKKIFF